MALYKCCLLLLLLLLKDTREGTKGEERKGIVSRILSRLDFGNANLTGIPAYLLQRLQSVY